VTGTWPELTALAGLAAVCWVLRIMLVVVVPARVLPQRLRDGLEHLAPAALAALVVVDLDATVRGDPPLTAAALVVATVAVALVVRRTGSMPLAIALALGIALVADLVVL
jgi:branched-subunit amino acid transport protein